MYINFMQFISTGNFLKQILLYRYFWRTHNLVVSVCRAEDGEAHVCCLSPGGPGVERGHGVDGGDV